MVQIKDLISEKAYERLFQLWFLCFPFGAGFLAFSLVFFTIYPFLLLSGVLFVLTLFFRPLRMDKFYFIVLGFWGFWLAYGLLRLFVPPVINFKDAIFDLRSLFMFLLTVYIVFQSVKILSWEKFKKNIADLSLALFTVFTIIGFFEFFTGIHLFGMHTLKIVDQPVSNFTYAPVFIFDNPNNFVTYYILLSLFLILFNEKINKNTWAMLALVLLNFFFSYISDARLGKISAGLMFIGVVFISRWKFNIWPYLLALVFAGLCFLWNPLFYGPMWKDGAKYQLNELTCIQTDTMLKISSVKALTERYSEDTLIAKISAYKKSKGESGNTRMGLIKNGMFLCKQSNFLGVGPGQYISYHRIKQVPVDVGTQLSAHCWLFEIFSQYGIIILAGYLAIFLIISVKALAKFRATKNMSVVFLMCILVLFIVSNIPSAFLLLDINWMFTALLLVFYKNEFSGS
ncbi:MAG TPA: O-antigen ligase family protein [Bacteroidales bacterium]|nr:O-antigen ligase family protein [Bacteroidales bacterium]